MCDRAIKLTFFFFFFYQFSTSTKFEFFRNVINTIDLIINFKNIQIFGSKLSSLSRIIVALFCNFSVLFLQRDNAISSKYTQMSLSKVNKSLIRQKIENKYNYYNFPPEYILSLINFIPKTIVSQHRVRYIAWNSWNYRKLVLNSFRWVVWLTRQSVRVRLSHCKMKFNYKKKPVAFVVKSASTRKSQNKKYQ